MNLYVLEKFEKVGNVRAMFSNDFSELSSGLIYMYLLTCSCKRTKIY